MLRIVGCCLVNCFFLFISFQEKRNEAKKILSRLNSQAAAQGRIHLKGAARALTGFTLRQVVVAPPASNRTEATLAELTLDGDGVAYATFITDRQLSHYIALAAELDFPRHKYPYKTLNQSSTKKVAYRKSQIALLNTHIAYLISQYLFEQHSGGSS